MDTTAGHVQTGAEESQTSHPWDTGKVPSGAQLPLSHASRAPPPTPAHTGTPTLPRVQGKQVCSGRRGTPAPDVPCPPLSRLRHQTGCTTSTRPSSSPTLDMTAQSPRGRSPVQWGWGGWMAPAQGAGGHRLSSWGGGEWPLTRPGTRFSPPPHQPPATRGVRWETPGEVQKDPPGSPGHPKTQSFSKREASGYSTRENNVRGFPYGGGGAESLQALKALRQPLPPGTPWYFHQQTPTACRLAFKASGLGSEQTVGCTPASGGTRSEQPCPRGFPSTSTEATLVRPGFWGPGGRRAGVAGSSAASKTLRSPTPPTPVGPAPTPPESGALSGFAFQRNVNSRC